MHPGLLANVVELLLHAIEMTPNLFQVINYQSHSVTSYCNLFLLIRACGRNVIIGF